jgi:PTS system fructose-specific IIC component
MNVIIITACPSGVATTFLAARGLERAAARRGWSTAVEMHSRLEPLVPVDKARNRSGHASACFGPRPAPR